MKSISILLLLVSLVFANQNKVEINFKNLEINEFVKMVSKISDKNILLNSKIAGKVNFISVKPIKKSRFMTYL